MSLLAFLTSVPNDRSRAAIDALMATLIMATLRFVLLKENNFASVCFYTSTLIQV